MYDCMFRPQPGPGANGVFSHLYILIGAGSSNIDYYENVVTGMSESGTCNGKPCQAMWLFLWKNTIVNVSLYNNYAENGTGCWNAGR